MAIKKSYYKPVSSNYALELRFKALRDESPDVREAAKQELIDRNTALAREANRRLTVLEKSEHYKKRWAARHAYAYIEEVSGEGATRFTTDPRLLEDIVDYQINIQRMSRFLRSTSSTIKGNRIIDQKILDAFRAKNVDISKEMEYEFLDFISSDSWEELKKSHVASTVLINDMVRISTKDEVELDDFFREMKKVADNAETYDIALKELGIPII